MPVVAWIPSESPVRIAPHAQRATYHDSESWPHTDGHGVFHGSSGSDATPPSRCERGCQRQQPRADAPASPAGEVAVQMWGSLGTDDDDGQGAPMPSHRPYSVALLEKGRCAEAELLQVCLHATAPASHAGAIAVHAHTYPGAPIETPCDTPSLRGVGYGAAPEGATARPQAPALPIRVVAALLFAEEAV